MIQYSKTGEEPRRTAEAYLNSIENAIKVRRKQFDALLDPALLREAAQKRKGAARLRSPRIPRSPPRPTPGTRSPRPQDTWRNILVPHSFIEGGAAFNSQLFGHARTLVRAAEERAKPNDERLPEYTEARLPAVVQNLKADRADLPGPRGPAPLVRPRAHARMAGPGRPAGAPGLRQRLARLARQPAGAPEHARRRRRRAWRSTRAARPRSTRARTR